MEKNLIDGVGMQSHISMSYPTIDLYKSAMQQYADLGLEIQVTELDISEKSNEYADQLALAQRYQDVFKMYKEMKDSGVNLSAVVLWGITDSTSWIGGYPCSLTRTISKAVLLRRDRHRLRSGKTPDHDGIPL